VGLVLGIENLDEFGGDGRHLFNRRECFLSRRHTTALLGLWPVKHEDRGYQEEAPEQHVLGRGPG
jgi:hypothetical protein